MTSATLVSIVVNTLDREKLLADVLRGLSQLRYPNFEIIVVKGPSRDGTDGVLSAWEDRIKVGSCRSANLSLSRNMGISMAAGEFVAFIDDDAVPHPQWIDRLIPVYGDPRVGGVGGYTVGQGGITFQARKIVCDRFGDAHHVSDYFDTRCLNVPGSWAYPSLLGTNCSFRRQALEDIGGFDETFSYYLDETDVCLRMMDAGWQIVFEPTALVWHRFSANNRRDTAATPKSIFEVIRSQTYFIHRHALRPWSVDKAADADIRLQRLAEQWRVANQHALEMGELDERQRIRLDRELATGMAEGVRAERAKADRLYGDLASHGSAQADSKPFPSRHDRLGICLISRAYGAAPASGVGRWTASLADALAERGHCVHVLTEACGAAQIRFHNGVWIHEVACEEEEAAWLIEAYNLPAGVATWAETVRRRIAAIKSFGLDVVSFPVWDLEGIGCLDDPDLCVAMSLGLTYRLSRQFTEEWRYRPLYREDFVSRIIEAERAALERAPLLLANDREIVRAIEERYGLNLGNRVVFTLPSVPLSAPPPEDIADVESRCLLRVLVVCAFQSDDLEVAASALAQALRSGASLFATVAGCVSETQPAAMIHDLNSGTIQPSERLRLLGPLNEIEMDAAYIESDLVLIPSWNEASGWRVVEAFSHGKPVILVAGEEATDLVDHGETGFLVQPVRDAAMTIAALLCELSTHRERLSLMGKNAWHASASRYSTKHMAKKIEAAFLDLVGSRDQLP